MNIKILNNLCPQKTDLIYSSGEIVSHSTITSTVINTKSSFIISELAVKSFVTDWLKYAIKELMSKNIKADKRLKNDLQLFKQRKKSLFELNDYVKETVMLSGKYRILDVSEDLSYKTELNYLDLVNILMSEQKLKTKTGYSYKHLIDRFFIEQWSKGKLLYPLFINDKRRFQRKLDYELFLQEHNIPILKTLYDYAKAYDKFSLFKTSFNVLLATDWKYITDVKNEDLLKIKELIEVKSLNKAQKGWYKNSLNFIVYALIEAGRTDLKTPYEFVNKLYPKEILFYKKVDELVEKCPNYIPLKKDLIEYINYLDIKERLAKSTIAIKRSYLMAFLDYLIKYKCDCVLLQKTFDDMFNFAKEDNIVGYFKNTKGKKSVSAIKDVAVFLGYAGYLSPYIKKMLPREHKKIKETPRIPFSVDMIKDLIDILLNRPPLEPTKWSREKADISWWKHDVYPVMPMLILLHLYIPVRGSQIRNLCRKKSFLLNDEGKIEKIIINTDKNRNRDYLQEIPFVFNGLEIFNRFLKWHKEYYSNLPLFEYDKNSPFDKIEPLFIQPLSLKPIDKKVHFTYLKRVLCQYRIELTQKDKKNIYFVYFTEEGKRKFGKDFFETVEELNNATNEFIDKYVKTIYDIHTFRVTGVTRYLEAGLPINVVMMLTGHTSPNIMLNVYNKLTYKEKTDLLKSAELKIMFNNPEKLEENTKEFIEKEILPNFDEKTPDRLKNILDKNDLFTQKVKKNSNSKAVDAINEIIKISPLNWIPVTGGICPGVKCPEGREKKCSLCPYFITGLYFIDGVIFRANNAILNFYQKVEEYNLSNGNVKVDDLELLMEEIYGWYEILNQIQKNGKTDNENDYPVKKESFVGNCNVPSTLAYLENFYNAKALNTSPNIYGIKVLTIKAMKLALKEKDKSIEEIVKDENKAVDYIMSYYQKNKHSPKLLTEFLNKLGENVQNINNIYKIGYNTITD
jgi:hypothetical protein